MKYFILAGEASGDNLGALLIKEINKLDHMAIFAYWGGDKMSESLALIDKEKKPGRHIKDLAFMGFAEVVKNLPTILQLIKQAKNEVKAFKPDVLVCIDYPGFNLRMAKWAKAQGIRVEFYVSPQIWAWRQSRVHKIIRNTDRVLCILPFEKDFYANHGYEVEYTGHPLPKRIDTHSSPRSLTVASANGPQIVLGNVLALLPGSRVQEIEQHLPTMLEALNIWRKSQNGQAHLTPVIAAAPTLSDEVLLALSRKYDIAWNRNSYDVLSHAHIACVASGTATLETALFNVPQIVCYKGSTLSVMLARKLIKVKYIALANLILNKAVVPELIQENFTAANIASKLKALSQGEAREKQLKQYKDLREKLQPYDATEAAAKLIVKALAISPNLGDKPR